MSTTPQHPTQEPAQEPRPRRGRTILIVTLGLVAILAIAGTAFTLGRGQETTAIPASSTPTTKAQSVDNYQVCHDKSFALMRDMLLKDSNLDGLTHDMYPAECEQLSKDQTDAIQAALQRELDPYIRMAAVQQAASES